MRMCVVEEGCAYIRRYTDNGWKPCCLQSAFFALLYEDSEGQNLLKSYALLW